MLNRARFILLGSCLLATVSASCGKPQTVSANDSAPAEGDGATAPALASGPAGPADVVRRAHRSRLAGDLSGLAECLVAEHRGPVRELVEAADRLVAAEEEFRSTVTRRLGHASAARVDRSGAADAIGVFSRNIRIVQERIDGDRATVTVQVADRVPLETVALVRREERWLIQTDPPIPEVAVRVRELAEVLLAMSRRVDRGEVTDATLSSELASQQAPVFRRLRALTREHGS